MGFSHRYGVGAVVKFKLSHLNVRRADRDAVRAWLDSTGVDRGQRSRVKWRGKLVGKRNGVPNRRGRQTFIYSMHPEAQLPPQDGIATVTGDELWDNSVVVEVPASKLSLIHI